MNADDDSLTEQQRAAVDDANAMASAVVEAEAQWTSEFAGVTAGFWHMSWIAGVVLLASARFGLVAHASGYLELEHDSTFRRPVPAGTPGRPGVMTVARRSGRSGSAATAR